MIRVAGLTCCVVLLLAGCGGGGEAQPTTPVATVSSTATGSPTAGASNAVAITVPPCTLITAAEVEAATGLTVKEIRDEPPISCVFDLGADAGVAIFINIEDGQGRSVGPASVFQAYDERVAAGNAVAVPDLGQAARYAPAYRGLAVDAGDGRFIALGVTGGFQNLQDPRDALISLAKAALGRGL